MLKHVQSKDKKSPDIKPKEKAKINQEADRRPKKKFMEVPGDIGTTERDE